MTEQRKIIHIDADCFFAAIEVRDDPRLLGLPVAVGGDAARRGVIATCNYEARAFGVHSAMASATARRLCPGLIIIPPRFEVYRSASGRMREIFHEYTDLVEPLSLDEAFLDVSAATQCQGSATLMAEEIRHRIRQGLGITVSAGIAPNKFIAKIASDWNKPDGIYVVRPEAVGDFVAKLPVKKIYGVGKVTTTRLQAMGVTKCGDLQRFDVFELSAKFGLFGKRLYELGRGIDDRAVKPDRRRKSLSVETTYAEDLADLAQCLDKLPDLLMELERRLSRVGNDYLVTRLYLKIKFADFNQTTVEKQHGQFEPTMFAELCREGFMRRQLPVRLLGVGVGFVDLRQRHKDQMELFVMDS